MKRKAMTSIMMSFLLIAYMTSWTWAFRDVGGVYRVDGPILKLSAGRIQGVRSVFPNENRSIDMFLGIPYAKPPISELRFEPPRDFEPWTGIKNTTQIPKSCPQNFNSYKVFDIFGVSEIDEDCLYLNVFLPGKLGENTKVPVMVWVHGGGFAGGSSTEEYLDARYFTKETKTIVVSINYRLGALGFLKSAHVAGNMGLLDQVKALKWVRKNIGRFGGNPCEITLFGQSAGAVSISLHLLSNMSKNLFQKAILQSGTFDSPTMFMNESEALRRSNELTKKLNCSFANDTLKCLKNKSAEEIVKHQTLNLFIMPYWFVPTIDGQFLTEHPSTTLINGTELMKKPLIVGFTEEESSYFLMKIFKTNLIASNLTDAVYKQKLFKLYTYTAYYPKVIPSEKVFQIFKNYPPQHNDTILNFYAAVETTSDSGFICPIISFISEYSRRNPNVYSYLLSQNFSQTPELRLLKSFHSIDLLFTFGHVIKYIHLKNYTETQTNLSLKMMQSWSSFANNSDPNTDSFKEYPKWPLYFPNGRYLTLNGDYIGAKVEGEVIKDWKDYRSCFCDFWYEWFRDI